MIKNRKYLIVLSIITLLCLCLCLSACGKNNKTSDVKDKTTISQDQTDDKTKDSKSGNNTAKDSGQKQDQPKVVYQKDGSGVETIDSKMDEQNPSASTQSPASTQESKRSTKPTSNPTPASEPEKTTEVKPQQGVEPVGESEKPDQTSEPSTPSSPTLSSAAKEYADYCAMSKDEQYAYYKSFKSADAFMKWYNAAKAAYDKENPAVELNPGDVIDLGN